MDDLQAELRAAARRREPDGVPPFDVILRRHRQKRRTRRAIGVASVSAATAATIVGVVIALGVAGPSPATVTPMATVPPGQPAQVVKVRGTMTMSGGPRHASPAVVAGKVVFIGGDGIRRETGTAGDGTFEIALPPGSYTVTGTSPAYQGGAGTCRAEQPVVVTSDGSPQVQVVCIRR